MKQTIAEIKKESLEQMAPLIAQMNKGRSTHKKKYFELKIGTKKTSLLLDDYWNPSFYLEKMDEVMDNQLIVKVCFNRVKSKGGYNEEKPQILVYQVDYRDQLAEVYQRMKTYWENYAAVKNIETVIFVYDYRLNEEWVPYLEKKQTPNEDEFYRTIFCESIRGISILGGNFSKTFKEKTLLVQKGIQTLEQVVDEVKLLETYKSELKQLYQTGLYIHYASKSLNISIKEEDGEVKIFIRDVEKYEITTFSIKEKQPIIDYLEKMKADQRLVNLIDTPKNNFHEVLSKMNISKYDINGSNQTESAESIKSLCDKAFHDLETMDGWEFVELEMGEVLVNGEITLTQHFNNVLSDRTYTIYKFKSTHNWYHAFQEGVTKKFGVKLEELKIFISDKEESEEVNSYFLEKIKNSITN